MFNQKGNKNMKKLLFVLPMILSLVFVSCSKDDDETNHNESQLIGIWIEDREDYENGIEVLHTEFKADYTGTDWVEDYGEIVPDLTREFVWSATENDITFIYDEGSLKYNYIIQDDKLHLSSEDETIVYLKQ